MPDLSHFCNFPYLTSTYLLDHGVCKVEREMKGHVQWGLLGVPQCGKSSVGTAFPLPTLTEAMLTILG